MKRFFPGLICLVALLAACGGGGGGGPTPPFNSPTPTPTSTPTLTPTTTTAQGTLVDDSTGAPLSGVTVRLDPWAAYPTPGPTPTPIAVSTTDPSGHFIVNASNGTYLLVIGDDAVQTPPPGWATPAPNATDTPIPGASTWRATIHDRIVLTGGGTVSAPLPLVAPTLIPQPLYTPPATETSGKYRLATIDALNEAPCYLYWNQLRQSHALAQAVLDEWSIENSRAISYVGIQSNGAGQTVKFLSQANMLVSGGANCTDMINPYWVSTTPRYGEVTNSQDLWVGIDYIPYNAQHSGSGAGNYPVDPRVFPDPNGAQWP